MSNQYGLTPPRLHVERLPIKTVNIDELAEFAISQCKNSIAIAAEHREFGDREAAIFMLNDAAEWRVLAFEFTAAVKRGGGL